MRGSDMDSNCLSNAVIAVSPPQDQPTYRQIMEGVWSLIGQGLAYIDYSQPAAENWMLHLTEAGRAAASDEKVTPTIREVISGA